MWRGMTGLPAFTAPGWVGEPGERGRPEGSGEHTTDGGS